jgi:acetylornithine/N-succinyldiaminopimelate aminotransferase
MNVARKAGIIRQGLEGLVSQFPDVFNGVIGSGLMLGLKCSASNIEVVNAGYEVGVLTVPAAENVVRVLPPLNILDEDIIIALEKLEKAAQIVRAAL